MDLYIRKILRVSVAQICQTIGYNSIQSIPLELLIDSLHKFLQEFARDLHRHVELFNRTEANLDDVALSLQSLNISANDLLEYINHVQPVGCSVEIPVLPAPKTSNLNFLKPGSKEVLIRPVHIYEHLPPILRDDADTDDKSNVAIISSSPIPGALGGTNNSKSSNENGEDIKMTPAQLAELNEASNNSGNLVVDNSSSSLQSLDIKRKPLDPTLAVPSSATREISSVMMTSGGFISPAIEGRTPECLIPDVVEKYLGLDAPPSATPVVAAPTQMAAPPGKAASSPTLNTSQSAISIRTLVKNENPNVGATGHKKNQAIDKKLLKKVKKKSMSTMLPPSMAGVVPPTTLNDKAQRKRIKMLQKSMAKNTANTANVTSGSYKNKGGNPVAQGSQDKYLKKQYKLKQKQMRQQYAQKQMEAALSAAPSMLGNGRGQSGHASSGDIGSGNKPKKDYFVVPPAPLPEDPPASETAIVNPFLQSLPFPPPKGLYHHTLTGPQDVKVNPPIAQVPQSALHGTLSPKYDEVKLSTEPDRSKLNIFKKISGRKERADAAAAAATHQISATTSMQLSSNTDVTAASSSSNTTIFGDDQVISLPSGTTITPAPPSGSGRHVYAPPPSVPSGDFDSVISVDDDGSIPEGSAVLMQRGDLMIHKPKKRGRKPGSKNQPKILGLNTKKAKKLKKSFFGHHSNSNLLEPLNLSNSSIANIANIPLGIASTFPIDSDAALKLKKDRKKAKLGKDANFIRGTGKSPSSRNLAPTKEEFASINQKLMMMDTVLQPAPPLQSSTHSPSTSRAGRANSPPFGVASSFPVDAEPTTKVKKERKKTKQAKEQKQVLHQGAQPLSSTSQSKSSSIGRKSPSPYTPPNFPNIPGMGGLPIFPFYPFPRPGLIPSHNLFSQMPNMQNNALFMPQLMGFRPLNPPIRSTLKDEKEPTPPLLQSAEGNYSKIAPLVADTTKLELPPPVHTSTLSPGVSGPKYKISSTSSATLTKIRASPSGQAFTSESNGGPSTPATSGNSLHFGDFRKKFEDHSSPAAISSSSGGNMNNLKNFEGTIEVSSDDSVQDDLSNKPSSLAQRSAAPSAVVSSSSAGLRRQSHVSNDFAVNEDVNVVEDSDTCPTERRNKEHKKNKKLGKQCKRQASSTGLSEMKIPRLEPSAGFDENIYSLQVDPTSESDKKNNESASSSVHTPFEYGGMLSDLRKDHKKMKKLIKEGKIKKKKDKKDKNKDRTDKMIKSEKSEKRKEEKKDKDKLKKLKKEKKREKQRTDIEVTAVKYSSSGEGAASASDVSVVPKLTLKLGQSSQSPTPSDTNESRKAGLKSTNSAGGGKSGRPIIFIGRESSPELARISPLVTRPPKQKSGFDDAVSSSSMTNVSSVSATSTATGQATSATHPTPSLSASLNIPVDSVIDIDSNSGGPTTSLLPASATILGGLGMNTTSNSSPGNNMVVGSSTSAVPPPAVHSGASQHNQHPTAHQYISSNKHSTAVPLISEANRPSSYIDAEGNRVWICPACGKVDDGSAMIGCDGCDAWYHWVCVGIFVAPNDNEDWYCRVCIAKKRGVHSGDRKRKRNKKKNVNS